MLPAKWESLLGMRLAFSSYSHSLQRFRAQIALFSSVAVSVVDALLLITWVSRSMMLAKEPVAEARVERMG